VVTLTRRLTLGIAITLLLILAASVAKQLFVPRGPAVLLVSVDGTARTVVLDTVDEDLRVTFDGVLPGGAESVPEPHRYTGILLLDLIDGAEFQGVRLVAADGEAVAIDRERVEAASPLLLLAYARDGVRPPQWLDGPQLVVLNAADDPDADLPRGTDVDSLWVSNVEEIWLLPEEQDTIDDR